MLTAAQAKQITTTKLTNKITFAEIEKEIKKAAEEGLYYVNYSINEHKFHIIEDCITYLEQYGYRAYASAEVYKGDRSCDGRRPESYKLLIINWNSDAD